MPPRISLFILFLQSTVTFAQVNSSATEKTKILYSNLKLIQESDHFLFGQEFFNSFRFSSGAAHGEKEMSDSKAVTGSHPALLGSDFHYYLEKSDTERAYHTEAVKWAYQQGYAITFDWHISGRGTNTYEYKTESKELVNNIVNNLNGDREWLYAEFDSVIDILNHELVVNGERIPVVFRPWHEMNGGWFWWGSQATNPDNYKALYRLTVDYFNTRTTSVLFCWSPNSPTNFDYYPGDEYVDVLGLDAYEVTSSVLQTHLTPIVEYAQTHEKVAVLSETGNRTADGDQAAAYWNNTVLPGIMQDPTGKLPKIAWVLTWINASWSFAYVPHSASSNTAKQSFIDFRNSPHVLFGDEIPNLYQPMDPYVAVKESSRLLPEVEVYPVPASGKLTIKVKNMQLPATISLYNNLGQEIDTVRLTRDTMILDMQKRGSVALIKVSNGIRVVSKRVIFK